MKILIVNDDGFDAVALPHIIRWARTLGDVTCVVPKREQSGKSQAIDYLHPVEITEVSIAEDIRVWAMDSTPADCVRFATSGLGTSYDLILSGINRGYNLGDDIAYSGTVGAINEGGRLGIPSIALSCDPNGLPEALGMLDGKVCIADSGLYTGKYSTAKRRPYVTVSGDLIFATLDVLDKDCVGRWPRYYLLSKGG